MRLTIVRTPNTRRITNDKTAGTAIVRNIRLRLPSLACAREPYATSNCCGDMPHLCQIQRSPKGSISYALNPLTAACFRTSRMPHEQQPSDGSSQAARHLSFEEGGGMQTSKTLFVRHIIDYVRRQWASDERLRGRRRVYLCPGCHHFLCQLLYFYM